MPGKFRILVLGGYGNFGRIIASKLASNPDVTVVIGGRDLSKAQRVAQMINCEAARVDSQSNVLVDTFRELTLDLVISTAGPFQNQQYQVARAAIDADIHYIDIADARGFVCGITQLNADALARNLLVVSGASSVPALSAAVIDELKNDFHELHEISFGISSSERLPGLATVRAVLGYAGKPFQQWRDGAWRTVYGWQDLHRHRFVSLLGTRWFANCDIPDLELFPRRYSDVRSVRFQAGLGLRITHFATWLVSWAVRLRIFKAAARWASLFRQVASKLEIIGNGRSGMFIECSGIATSGHEYRTTWELIASGNDGVNIPCLAAVALACKLASGALTARGAVPCVGMLTLNEYLAELEGLQVVIARR